MMKTPELFTTQQEQRLGLRGIVRINKGMFGILKHMSMIPSLTDEKEEVKDMPFLIFLLLMPLMVTV